MAGGVRPCSYPAAFESATVNAVILPYRFEGPSEVPSGHGELVGEQLAALVQAETLLSMLKWGRVAATRMYETDRVSCSQDFIVRHLTEGSRGSIKPGNALVLISGRIYIEGSQIYLQSYIRFLRRDVKESIAVSLPVKDGIPLVLHSEFSTQVVAMQPRAISVTDLENVDLAFRSGMVVRPTRDEQAPGKRISLHPMEPFSYSVVESQGDWMKIESDCCGPSGWIRARTSSKGWALRNFLPELGYLDALVGYEALTATGGMKGPDAQRKYGWITDEFNEYENAVGSDGAPLAHAVGRVLRGFLLWNRSPTGEPGDSLRKAAKLFAESLTLSPDNADVRNLAAITRFYLAGNTTAATDSGGTLLALDRDLTGALAVDSKNRTTLENLSTLYDYESEGHTPGPADPDGFPDIERRKDVVHFALQSLK